MGVSSLSRGYQHISSNMAECVNSDFMKKAFKGYDLNNDGKVSVEEFKRVMMKTGRVTPEAIEKMLGKADKDSDGNIDFEEFQKMLSG